MDFNGDGRSDLIVGAIAVPGFEPLQVRAYADDGTGLFRDVTASTIPESAMGRSWSMAVGDVNGDRVNDLLPAAGALKRDCYRGGPGSVRTQDLRDAVSC